MRLKFWLLSLVLIPLSIWTTKFGFWGYLFAALVLVSFGFGVADIIQVKQTIRKNFPLLGRIRYVFEALRPKIYQYFVESDLDGRPINRISRSVVYQRAKRTRDTIPFGTQLDVYETGYEWINHSMNPLDYHEINKDPKVLVGNQQCEQPYSCSIFNISAMSYGSLSKNAVMALNKGAALGGFAHNTGEGGVSPYHLKYGGDLIWQIGTGYFGCRDDEGKFSEERFKETASHPNIKMIEIKISQGAKPGHGGILPAVKNNEEIAKIRGVKPWTTVLSPPSHSAFKSPAELCFFITRLRSLSGGKPVGIKLCIGKRIEFIELCKTMIEKNVYPDYIAVDGGEGGTGAAPLEFTNRLGSPLMDALVFVKDILDGYDIKKHIKIIASGKVMTAFDLVKLSCLGADIVYSARAMMLALGCIQALECNSNTCPTGITTHDRELVGGLDIEDKSKRIHAYHDGTLDAFAELLGASGIKDVSNLERSLLYRRQNHSIVKRYDQIYPNVEYGSLLQSAIPEHLQFYFS